MEQWHWSNPARVESSAHSVKTLENRMNDCVIKVVYLFTFHFPPPLQYVVWSTAQHFILSPAAAAYSSCDDKNHVI